MLRLRSFALLALTFALLLCSAPSRADDIWIWPSAYRTRKLLPQNQPYFVLQRHFSASGEMRAMGPSPWPWPAKELTIVFRFERKPEPKIVLDEFLKLRALWEAKGVRIAGLQLDYDSPSSKLGLYQGDIETLRRNLPQDMALSITGLTDWLKLDRMKLNGFDRSHSGGQPVTVYFQLYQESREHHEKDMHLAKLAHAKFPFKIGLLPKQVLAESDRTLLSQNPNFSGYAIFYGKRL